jgi:hypothetical protein
MTDNDAALSSPTSGEARLKAKRNAFLRYFSLAMLAGFAAGIASGVAAAMVEDGSLPKGVLIALWAVTIGLFVWFSRDYFRRVDELDLLDNLWASTIGLYGYIAVFGTWYLFHDVGIAPEMDQIAIMLATLAITTAAYIARKLGWR